MHEFLLARAGLNYCYLAFRVPRERLPEALLGMRALGIRGFNVTIPHKEAVIPYLDGLSPEAEAVGAVNVIANRTENSWATTPISTGSWPPCGPAEWS